ncbi:MAG: adenylylsulfate kinase [Algoriphagus sp.]|jgi:adenylylsulfate kinase
MNVNIIPHQHIISQADRRNKYGFSPYLLWFTGLSGSGKSTLASAIEKRLFDEDYCTYLLDGDNIRSGLNGDLDFSADARSENIRRISEVSKLFLDAGLMVLSAFISPFNEDRELARSVVGEDNFIEIFVDTPLHVCESRDVKGLYAKARKGEIPNFTGIQSPFEIPQDPDIHVLTEGKSIEETVNWLFNQIKIKIA